MKNSSPAIQLLGVAVHKLTIHDQLKNICDSILNNKHLIFANHNLHSVYLYHHDPKMRSFYSRANSINIDGMSLVLIGRLLGHSLTRHNRMTCLDWLPPLLKLAEQDGWRAFYLGARPDIARRGVEELKSRYPKLQIASFHGYFDSDPKGDENRQVVTMINAYRPHLLLVGMGMPRQEQWIADNSTELNANAIINVGAYIDYIAGAIPTPPRWVGRIGLEWLYRLLSEPKRLWRRYLVEPWFIAHLFVREVIRQAVGDKERRNLNT